MPASTVRGRRSAPINTTASYGSRCIQIPPFRLERRAYGSPFFFAEANRASLPPRRPFRPQRRQEPFVARIAVEGVELRPTQAGPEVGDGGRVLQALQRGRGIAHRDERG